MRDLALSYVARFSTTGVKLERYLSRKINERGIAEDEEGRARELDVQGLVMQFVELGYIDDDVYARSKSRDLTARGYGARRVEQALWAAGVEEELRENNAPDEAECRRAAILLAKKRRFGPYGLERQDLDDGKPDHAAKQKQREKQLAAMVRAGHSFDHARFIVDASAIEEVEEWLIEAEEEQATNQEGEGFKSW